MHANRNLVTVIAHCIFLVSVPFVHYVPVALDLLLSFNGQTRIYRNFRTEFAVDVEEHFVIVGRGLRFGLEESRGHGADHQVGADAALLQTKQ
jgi:hypothetical protein